MDRILETAQWRRSMGLRLRRAWADVGDVELGADAWELSLRWNFREYWHFNG